MMVLAFRIVTIVGCITLLPWCAINAVKCIKELLEEEA